MDTFVNNGHTEEWLKTNYIMQIIGYYIKDIPVLDSEIHTLCAVAHGYNYCDNFVREESFITRWGGGGYIFMW